MSIVRQGIVTIARGLVPEPYCSALLLGFVRMGSSINYYIQAIDSN